MKRYIIILIVAFGLTPALFGRSLLLKEASLQNYTYVESKNNYDDKSFIRTDNYDNKSSIRTDNYDNTNGTYQRS